MFIHVWWVSSSPVIEGSHKQCEILSCYESKAMSLFWGRSFFCHLFPGFIGGVSGILCPLLSWLSMLFSISIQMGGESEEREREGKNNDWLGYSESGEWETWIGLEPVLKEYPIILGVGGRRGGKERRRVVKTVHQSALGWRKLLDKICLLNKQKDERKAGVRSNGSERGTWEQLKWIKMIKTD